MIDKLLQVTEQFICLIIKKMIDNHNDISYDIKVADAAD